MLTVYRKRYYGGADEVIGYFANVEDIYNHFRKIYIYQYNGTLENLFSHNPCEFYVKHFHNYHRDVDTNRYTFDKPIYCMVVENEKGIRYSRDFLAGEFRRIRKKNSKIRYYFYGYKRHSRGSYYRRPKTLQERRMAVNVMKEEGEPNWRASRGFRGLPSSWDDIPHSDGWNDNWKRYRKTRWK